MSDKPLDEDDNNTNNTVVLTEPLSVLSTKAKKLASKGGIVITYDLSHEYVRANIDVNAKIVVELTEHRKPKNSKEKVIEVLNFAMWNMTVFAIGIAVGLWIGN